CYAGYRGEERPLRFTMGERTLTVREIQDRWYSPDAGYFRVVADDAHVYILRHDEARGQWTLEGFRAAGR
ncbi:MAG: hypothetical protein FJW35_15925, partial [Acidobacteria bacterium]|nr:hypothetical protein [Acidobacteriota bacterium]